jgi:hypothetical protein
MKTYEELARGALARAKEKKKKRNRRIRICASAFAAVIAVTAAVLIRRLPQTAPAKETVPNAAPAVSEAAPESVVESVAGEGQPETAQHSTVAGTTEAAVPDETMPSSTAAVSAGPSGANATENAAAGVTDPAEKTDGAGEIFGGEKAGLPAQVNGFVYTGEPITDEEAAAYFSANLDAVLSSLTASGVSARGARVRYPGYSHMTLNETGDVRLNYRDYQLWVDQSLVAVVTLYRLDGELHATPSFGAPWFASFAAFLRQHAGEKLLFFYNGFTELVLTPANEVYDPVGERYETGDVPGLDYERLYCEEIAFMP